MTYKDLMRPESKMHKLQNEILEKKLINRRYRTRHIHWMLK